MHTNFHVLQFLINLSKRELNTDTIITNEFLSIVFNLLVFQEARVKSNHAEVNLETQYVTARILIPPVMKVATEEMILKLLY